MDVCEVSAEDIELEYVSTAGIRERGSLGHLWPVRFESVRPERRFPAFRGQGNWCGWYWSATCGGHGTSSPKCGVEGRHHSGATAFDRAVSTGRTAPSS